MMIWMSKNLHGADVNGGVCVDVFAKIGSEIRASDIPKEIFGKVFRFASVTHPNHFMRAHGSEGSVWINERDESKEFQEDSAFTFAPGLTGADASVSLRSIKYPHHYLRERNGEMYLEEIDE